MIYCVVCRAADSYTGRHEWYNGGESLHPQYVPRCHLSAVVAFPWFAMLMWLLTCAYLRCALVDLNIYGSVMGSRWCRRRLALVEVCVCLCVTSVVTVDRLFGRVLSRRGRWSDAKVALHWLAPLEHYQRLLCECVMPAPLEQTTSVQPPYRTDACVCDCMIAGWH